MKTYLEGDRFPGKVGRTIADSEAAFPMPPEAPEGAPNVMYIVIDDIGFGWIEPFGGAIRTPNIARLAEGGLRCKRPAPWSGLAPDMIERPFGLGTTSRSARCRD